MDRPKPAETQPEHVLGRNGSGDDCGAPNAENPRDRGRGQHGCAHYRRRVKLVTPCCNQVYWCRHCHNEAQQAPSVPLEKRHALDRSIVKEVVCALCGLRQPIGSECVSCGVAFGAYTCTRCPFYDDNLSKRPFHCDDCGLCRVGGRERYFHCKTCGSCYSLELRGAHRCVERAMHANCPVCFEYLFDSTASTTVLSCGHTIHSDCLSRLEQSQNMAVCAMCPICKRSIHDNADLWRRMHLLARTTVQPPEYEGWEADILCNDCLRTARVPFNIVGLRCEGCGSYNTSRLSLLGTTAQGTDEHGRTRQLPAMAAVGPLGDQTEHARPAEEGPAPAPQPPAPQSEEEPVMSDSDGGELEIDDDDVDDVSMVRADSDDPQPGEGDDPDVPSWEGAGA